ncbi:hypothetical protein GIB67_008849 [Kingdonia uniflora]|uniref:Uncharacterized protein n=1 Tax=Kingdonia uniflora TaxID=39325 RepID=A0A7J7LV91_9MAGN|nr:hypothetical protein GIB67_008849 [Kingdonia uniflora]
MWVGIKYVYFTVLNYSTWIIGIGSAINAWRNNWTGMGIISNIPALSHLLRKSYKLKS